MLTRNTAWPFMLCCCTSLHWRQAAAGKQQLTRLRNIAAQSVGLAVAALRLITKEEERQAGLAIASTMRKRLLNLPGGLASDAAWRVRFPVVLHEQHRTGRCPGAPVSLRIIAW